MTKIAVPKDVQEKLNQLSHIQKDIETVSTELFGIDDQIERLINKKAKLQVQLVDLQLELQELLTIEPAKKTKTPKGEKEEAPEPGTAPYELVQYMSPTTPIQLKDLAKKAGKGVATVRQYLNKYNCFINQRGKGYICTISKK